MEKWMDKGLDWVISNGPHFLLAILVLIVGFWVIKKITQFLRRLMEKRGTDKSLHTFLISLVNIGLKVLLIISVADMVGIATTSFVAVLGAAGLAVGLALQGALQNFAGGVLILIFKPYKVGDLIESQGQIGVVKEIQIFVTTLISPENRTVIMPNGPVANGHIVNYTEEGRLRLDLDFGISYNADIKQAKEVLLGLMKNHPKIMQDPAPFVGVKSLGDSAINLAVRAHTTPGDFWDVYFELYETGKEALDQAGIEIPFPQMVVHNA